MAVKKIKKEIIKEFKLDVLSADGKKKSECTVKPKEAFLKNRSQAIHDVAVMHLANRRSGTASTKSRGEINKSTKKPWKQKGTGNARAGRASSPLWIGGGVVHGPRPRNFGFSVPKKMKRLTLCASVVEKIRCNEVIVVEELKLKEPKTKLAAELLNKLDIKSSALLVTAKIDPVLNRAVRNIPKIATTTVTNLNTLDLIKHKKIVLTQDGFDQISKLLQGK